MKINKKIDFYYQGRYLFSSKFYKSIKVGLISVAHQFGSGRLDIVRYSKHCEFSDKEFNPANLTANYDHKGE